MAAIVPAGRKAVVVFPSYSGSFALPNLVDPEHSGNSNQSYIAIKRYKFLLVCQELFCGFVPVAPGSATSRRYKEAYPSVRVPTLIVVGENDGRRSSEALAAIPTSTKYVLGA